MTGSKFTPDAPVYNATPKEMEDLAQLIANASSVAMKYGAVRIDPPQNWTPPPLRMRPDSRFFVRMQTLPAAPFVDTSPPIKSHPVLTNDVPQSQPRPSALPSDCPTLPTKRRNVRRHIVCNDDDEADSDLKSSKLACAIPRAPNPSKDTQMQTQGPSLKITALPSSTQPTLKTPNGASTPALNPPRVPMEVDNPAPSANQRISAFKPSQAPATQQLLATTPDGPVSSNVKLDTDGDISPAILKNMGPSQAEMMMSTAAAARQALSPFKTVDVVKRVSPEAPSGLELGDSAAKLVEIENVPVHLRSIPAPHSGNKTALNTNILAASNSFPLSQRAMAGGIAAGHGQRNLARSEANGAAKSLQYTGQVSSRSPHTTKRPPSVVRVQAGNKATPPSGKRKFIIPRSVPLPLPNHTKPLAIRSVPLHVATEVRGLAEQKDATTQPCDRVKSDHQQHALDCSKPIKPTAVGAADQKKRSPSRPSMDIDLLLNPADEPLPRKNAPSLFNRGRAATAARMGRQSTKGASGNRAAGGDLNSLLNHEVPREAALGANTNRRGASPQGPAARDVPRLENRAKEGKAVRCAPADSAQASGRGHGVEAATQALQGSHLASDGPYANSRVQSSAKGNQPPTNSREVAANVAVEWVDEVLLRVDRDAAARLRPSHLSRLAHAKELQCTETNVRDGTAHSHPTSASLDCKKTEACNQGGKKAREPAPMASGVVTIRGLGHGVSVTEPQALAAVLTHDPVIAAAGQESKLGRSPFPGSKETASIKKGRKESSLQGAPSSKASPANAVSGLKNQTGTKALSNGKPMQVPLRLKLKLRDTGPTANVNVRRAPAKDETGLKQLGAGPSPATQLGSNQPLKHSSMAADRAEAESKQKRRKVGKSLHKRRINHVSDLKWNQDKTGRLTKPIVFPDSQAPVTLRNYKRKALSFEEKLWGSLEQDRSFDIEDMKKTANVNSDDWMRNPDILEQVFWTAIEKGVEGVPVVVPYGVDVEVEGAFDSMGMSYVEWYGDGTKGRKSRKKKGTARKGKEASSAGPQAHTPATKEEEAHAGDQIVRGANAPTGLEWAPSSVKPSHAPVLLGKEQKKQILPIAPKSHVGNLNSKGLLRHMPRMPGINHSMYYVGQLLSRFCWHVEDAFLNSVSYLHPGSAPKIWYAVPPSHASRFEDYATSNIFSHELLDNVGSGQFLLANKTTMFNPRKLAAAGVEVYRVVHRPGSFVLTAPRAYHAGFNCGYNVAEAVNYANPAWFPVGREASRFARTLAKPLCVPWEYLLFHEAKATRDLTLGTVQAPKAKGLKEDARILAEELYQVVSQGEFQIRAYAGKTNCRVAVLNEVPALVQNNQLGPEFGHGAGLVCSICGHSCHFYAEICGSCDDSFEARCVEHFGQGHRLCLHKDHKTILVRRHDPVLVADILTKLEELAGINRTTSELLERFRGYLRPWETPLRRSGLRLKLNFSLAASRLPPVMAGSKYSKETSQKEKGRKGKKRSESETREDRGSDQDGERKMKRRKVAKRKAERERRPSVEPVAPVVIPKLEAVCDVPDGSSPVPTRTCHIFPGMDRMALKASYMERKRASLKAAVEESDDGSESFIVPNDRKP